MLFSTAKSIDGKRSVQKQDGAENIANHTHHKGGPDSQADSQQDIKNGQNNPADGQVFYLIKEPSFPVNIVARFHSAFA